MIEQNAAGVMTRKPVDDMSDAEVRAFVEQAAEKLGLTVEEAKRRYLQDPEPAGSASSRPDSRTDSGTDSHGFVDPRDEPDVEQSMVSSSEPEPDPLDSHPTYEQTRREMSGEADDLEAQAARAFWSPREVTYPHAHETSRLLEQIRCAYRR